MRRARGRLRAGDAVWCRTSEGHWVYKIALTSARRYHGQGARVGWASIPVVDRRDWAMDGANATYVHWPAGKTAYETPYRDSPRPAPEFGRPDG